MQGEVPVAVCARIVVFVDDIDAPELRIAFETRLEQWLFLDLLVLAAANIRCAEPQSVIVAKLRRYLCEQRVKARPVFLIAQTQRLSLVVFASERG